MKANTFRAHSLRAVVCVAIACRFITYYQLRRHALASLVRIEFPQPTAQKFEDPALARSCTVSTPFVQGPHGPRNFRDSGSSAILVCEVQWASSCSCIGTAVEHMQTYKYMPGLRTTQSRTELTH